MNNNKDAYQRTIQANVDVHSALANSGEYNKSPHFRQENKDKVRKIVESLISDSNVAADDRKLLDMGCGTGFMLEIASDLFAEAHGVDITDDMMNKVDPKLANVQLKKAYAEDTGYAANKFDMVTAYSFLDHLLDYESVLAEAYRVMKPGAVFYSDLNPNRAFTEMLGRIEKSDSDPDSLPVAISREIKGMLHNGEYYQESFGISEETLIQAEPQKSFKKGFDANEVRKLASDIGFSEVSIEFDWFLGQGVLMNSDSSLSLSDIDDYLTAMLPAAEPFYKYLRFIFFK